MSAYSSVNLSSLSIVSGELGETLQLAFESWQAVQANPEDTTQLKASLQNVLQANGALALLELHGMCELGRDLEHLLQKLIAGDCRLNDNSVFAVAQALSAMPSYLDYVRASGSGKPALLLPALNLIRSLAGLPRLVEHTFSEFALQGELSSPELALDSETDADRLALSIRRLRQMYQTGIIGLIRDEDSRAALALMQRATERMYGLLRQHPGGQIWLLIAAAVCEFSEGRLALDFSRQRLLMAVDKIFRLFAAQTAGQISRFPDADTQAEWVYLIGLVSNPGPLAELVSTQINIDCSETEASLQADMAYVYQLNRDIEQARLDTLTNLLASSREYLDAASRADQYQTEDLDRLHGQLVEMLNSLQGLGGETLAQLLAARASEVKSWVEAPDNVTWDRVMPLADVLIMLESVLENARVPVGQQQDPVERADQTALSSAELAVIGESQAGLNLAKRAITSYVESGFDEAHLGNIATTLRSVRGGLEILHEARAADILLRATRFIESALGKESAKDESLLHTLADALISLEYYLAQLQARNTCGDDVLNVADDSLTEIGYPAMAA